jgi:hypothetical protein
VILSLALNTLRIREECLRVTRGQTVVQLSGSHVRERCGLLDLGQVSFRMTGDQFFPEATSFEVLWNESDEQPYDEHNDPRQKISHAFLQGGLTCSRSNTKMIERLGVVMRAIAVPVRVSFRGHNLPPHRVALPPACRPRYGLSSPGSRGILGGEWHWTEIGPSILPTEVL